MEADRSRSDKNKVGIAVGKVHYEDIGIKFGWDWVD
jgi:hypothetical protein